MGERLAGKVALITGAARGTGAAIARCFVGEGAEVTLVDVLDERGQTVADELGSTATYRHLDVTDEAGWVATVDDVRARHGRLDVLVNNAAVLHLATIDMTTADADESLLCNGAELVMDHGHHAGMSLDLPDSLFRLEGASLDD